MQNTLSQRVAYGCAKAVSEALGSWLIKNPLPAYVQPKYDGTRVWMVKKGQECVLATKHNGVYTAKQYPELFKVLQELPGYLILDCEFMKAHNDKQGSLAVFDVIHVGAVELKITPLITRLKVLHQLDRHFDQKYVYQVPSVIANSTEEIDEQFNYFVNAGFEGIVIKNPASGYSDPDAWLKRKVYDTIDCFVTARDAEHEGYSFHIGCFDKLTGELVDMGKVGSFIKDVDCNRIARGTILEIQYQQLTRERHLRHPFVTRIREDKIAKECRI